ncbi:MAG: group 1 truncated hemoglobin [Myxococcales bacterium]|nr:group 1 truncated hemoglobin [Myxococcales bacterium]MCA9696740.1 group 1 truncated hemoglobin [Myxococcales bacterium]
MTEALFQRLGGRGTVTAAAGLLYQKVMADERLAPFFADIDLPAQIKKQTAFMTMAFAGPHDYDGRDLRTAHASLVARGLNDAHFAAILEHLGATLRELGVPDGPIGEVMAIMGATKADVLGR